MIEVHEALNLREANMVATYLEDQGVPAEVTGGAYQAVVGELSNIRGTLPKVLVGEEDGERAAQLVSAFLASLRNAPEGEPWTCGCGEVLEPQFLSCWKCQAVKPG
jgi:hypothetical protein